MAHRAHREDAIELSEMGGQTTDLGNAEEKSDLYRGLSLAGTAAACASNAFLAIRALERNAYGMALLWGGAAAAFLVVLVFRIRSEN
jgi:hypothetical protein